MDKDYNFNEYDDQGGQDDQMADFESMMAERIQSNFAAETQNLSVTNERLQEMNKKLPDWNLEPPYSFLK